MTDYVSEASVLSPELVRLRRELHADPEVGLQTPRTQARVLDALAGLGLEITTGTQTTSVVAVLRGGLPGPTVLLRGDMDGLPIAEQTHLPFAASGGVMHACGHDLHTTALVGAARLLSAHAAELPGSVIFMFQPGEEGQGGAKVMIEEGVLDAAGERPIAAYATHVGPGPFGTFATRASSICAGSAHLEFTVTGRGGHGSQPHQALDPVPVVAEIVLALQTLVTRHFDAFDPVIISVTQLSTTSSAHNVIPDSASAAATVRALTPAAVARLEERIPRLVKGIAEAQGMEAEVSLDFIYPPTVNDPATTRDAMAVLRKTFGPARVVEAPTPLMGSEDFSFVLAEIPGTFVAVLASPPEGGAAAMKEFNHSPRVVFDDAILADQAAALATLAHARLDQARREH